MVRSDDHDVIRFEDGLFANFDALVASGDMTQSGADVVIKYGASDQVTLKNVSLTNLTAQDFTFDAPAAVAGSIATISHAQGVTYHVANDFNGDGISDVLFGKDNGSLAVWELNGNHIALNATVGSVPAGWHVDGIGDFGNDGKSDILLHSDSGQVAMWQMDGNHIASNTTVGSVSSAWHVSEVADFNGDGKADVLWQNTNGQVAMWQMDGDHIAANTTVGSAPGWTVIGTGDYSHDGKADVLWQNASGNVAQWQMNGDHIDENLSVGSHSIDWHVV